MDFESYFQATEESFAGEKADMLQKVEKLTAEWTESARLDQEIIDKTKELVKLKQLVSGSHLQILRTKEECLHVLLKNSQNGFHVRQLQSEIFRLLELSHTEVPSTEYHMSVVKNFHKEEKSQVGSEADEERTKDISKIHKMWDDICQRQQEVFAEERLHYTEDEEQWGKFSESIQRQNEEQHKALNKMMTSTTQKYLSLKASNEDMTHNGEERAKNLLNKLNKLKGKIDDVTKKMKIKKEEDKIHAQNEANKLLKELRRRVAFIEENNQLALERVNEELASLQDLNDDLLDDIDDYNKKIEKLERTNALLNDECDKKIVDLEAQLAALINAATAIKDTPYGEQINVINAVSAAVGSHSNAATKTEQIHQKISSLNKRFKKETGIAD